MFHVEREIIRTRPSAALVKKDSPLLKEWGQVAENPMRGFDRTGGYYVEMLPNHTVRKDPMPQRDVGQAQGPLHLAQESNLLLRSFHQHKLDLR